MGVEEIIENYDHSGNKNLVNRLIQLLQRFKKTGLSAENITSLLMSVMIETKKLKNLKGYEKKQLAINIMTYFVEEIIPGDTNPLEDVLKPMIPTLIDNFSGLMSLKKMSCWFTK